VAEQHYAGTGRIGVDIGYTRSARHEIDTGNIAGENMFVHDIPYSIKYQVEGGKSGLNLRKDIKNLTLSGGLRYDLRNITGQHRRRLSTARTQLCKVKPGKKLPCSSH
jgi:hypothetical protein